MSMVQAASQLLVDEEEVFSSGVGNLSLPMFHESASIAGGASPHNGNNGNVGSSSNITHANGSRLTPASPRAIVSSASGAGPSSSSSSSSSLAARPGRRELRSRRQGIEMTAITKTFSGPDTLQGVMGEPGTFRWDSSVEGTSAGLEAEDQGGDDSGGGIGEEMQPRGIGMPLRRKRTNMRFRPVPRDLEIVSSVRNPWYIIVPESRTHQVFDHLGECFSPYNV